LVPEFALIIPVCLYFGLMTGKFVFFVQSQVAAMTWGAGFILLVLMMWRSRRRIAILGVHDTVIPYLTQHLGASEAIMLNPRLYVLYSRPSGGGAIVRLSKGLGTLYLELTGPSGGLRHGFVHELAGSGFRSWYAMVAIVMLTALTIGLFEII